MSFCLRDGGPYDTSGIGADEWILCQQTPDTTTTHPYHPAHSHGGSGAPTAGGSSWGYGVHPLALLAGTLPAPVESQGMDWPPGSPESGDGVCRVVGCVWWRGHWQQ